jgi:BirA family biotin operon repressor/biotin-[acetyl-CoA-carboxylase] ligase
VDIRLLNQRRIFLNMLIIKLPKVTSTQDFAEAVSRMLYEDFIVVAEEQTSARGRFRRYWYSPRGGLWFTYVKKNFPTSEVPMVSLKASLAVRKSLSKYLEAKIRWPNDVVIGYKKISGILIEAFANGENADLFIGIGVNVNVSEFPKDIIATSLLIETGKEYNISDILNDIINNIDIYLKADNISIINEINEHLSIKEKEVKLYLNDGEKVCKAFFVDFLGRLVTDCGIYEVEEVIKLQEII